jgi:glutathione S-transferase
MTTTLFGWGPMFGLRGPSPFVLKAEIQLQMLGVRFERAIAELEAVSKHKAPYVRDGEQLIEDSTFIRMHFERKLDRHLDARLTREQRAAAWAFERLLEDRLYFIAMHERWLVDANFHKGPAQFFGAVPAAQRDAVITQVRDGLRQMLIRHGIGRHSREERMELAARDIAAVADLLGEKSFLFGSEPSATDAVAFGMLSCCATRFFDSPLPDLVERHAGLVAYLERMDDRFFRDVTWPASPGS